MPESIFNKVAGFRPATLLKKRLWHRRFPVDFAKFLRTPFPKEHLWCLLLMIVKLSEREINIFLRNLSLVFLEIVW